VGLLIASPIHFGFTNIAIALILVIVARSSCSTRSSRPMLDLALHARP
jgi:hypothetical protein